MAEQQIPKPEPPITETTRPFWEGTKRNELMLRKCVECGHHRNPLVIDANICPNCGSRKPSDWVKASGRGTVHTFTVVHRIFHPAFEAEAPYVIVIGELEEGPRLLGNMRGIAPDKVKGGMPIEVIYEELNDKITLPQFRPAKALA